MAALRSLQARLPPNLSLGRHQQRGEFLLRLGRGILGLGLAEPRLLVGWFISQSIELGATGAVIGSGLAGASIQRISSRVALLVVAPVALTILIQSLGLAPAARLV